MSSPNLRISITRVHEGIFKLGTGSEIENLASNLFQPGLVFEFCRDLFLAIYKEQIMPDTRSDCIGPPSLVEILFIIAISPSTQVRDEILVLPIDGKLTNVQVTVILGFTSGESPRFSIMIVSLTGSRLPVTSISYV